MACPYLAGKDLHIVCEATPYERIPREAEYLEYCSYKQYPRYSCCPLYLASKSVIPPTLRVDHRLAHNH